MTLIELLILLAVVFVVVFIALPTLKPAKSSNVERFARKRLQYLYERERAYFLRNGHYNSFAVLAQAENGGPFLDRRYTGVVFQERGVVFKGPEGETSKLTLTAELLQGNKYFRIDSKGRITEHKGKPRSEVPAPEKTPESTVPQEHREAGAAEPPKVEIPTDESESSSSPSEPDEESVTAAKPPSVRA